MSTESERRRRVESERRKVNIQNGELLWDALDFVEKDKREKDSIRLRNEHVNERKRCIANRNFLTRLREIGLFRRFQKYWSDGQ